MSLSYEANTSCPVPLMLHFDSRDADHPTTRDYYAPDTSIHTGSRHDMQADCEYHFRHSIVTPANCTLYAQILHCTISNTFYNVQAGYNDTITIDAGNPDANLAGNPGLALLRVKLDPGHYTNETVAAHMQMRINQELHKAAAIGPLVGGWAVVPVFDVTVVYETSLRKLRVSVGPLQTTSFRIIFFGGIHPAKGELREIIGLRKAEELAPGVQLPAAASYGYDAITKTNRWTELVAQPEDQLPSAAFNQGVVFPLACDIGADVRSIQIKTNLSAGESAFNSVGLGDADPSNAMLACASQGGKDPDAAVSLIATHAPLVEVNIPSIHHIRVSIVDSAGNLLDLNGGSFQMSLRFQWVYSGIYRKSEYSREDHELKNNEDLQLISMRQSQEEEYQKRLKKKQDK